MKNKFNKKCNICSTIYMACRESSKFCSKKCSQVSQKGTKRPHTKEHTEKRLAAVKKSIEGKVYPNGYKRPTEHTQAMLNSLKKWQKENPELSIELSIRNLPKDTALEKNGNWKNGKTAEYKDYRIKNYSKYNQWRQICLKRDGNKCKLCNSTENLEVHHIIPISKSKRTAWLRMNGVTLCRTCHKENDECWGNGIRFDVPEAYSESSIICHIVRPEFQEYSTCGNYQDTEDGLSVFFITKQKKKEYELLIFIHELVEWSLCKSRGITEEVITNFDLEWNKKAESSTDWYADGIADEPGNEPNAPYVKEHRIAENFERLFAEYMQIDWFEYNRNLIL